MRSGRCPRCDASAVYANRNGIISGDKHVFVRGLGFSSPRTDKLTYLCAACGYYENYIIDQAILEKVTRKWDKV